MVNGPGAHVVLLFGPPAAGKLTVARELTLQLESRGIPVRLVDNHYVNNVILRLVGADGKTPLAPEVWDRVAEVRTAVFHTISTLSPPDWTFILTFAFEPGDEQLFERVASLAEARGARFLPVEFICQLDELERRVVSPDREAALKAINVDVVRRFYEDPPGRRIDHPDTVTLDVTSLSAAEAAVEILGHIDARG